MFPAEMKNKREQQQTPGGGQPAVGVRTRIGREHCHRPASTSPRAVRWLQHCGAGAVTVLRWGARGPGGVVAAHSLTLHTSPQRFGPPSEEAVSEAEEKRKLVGPPEIKSGEVRGVPLVVRSRCARA